MSAIAAAIVGSTVVGAVASNSASKRAANAAKDAANASQVDIDALDKKTRDMALRNAHESAALERQLTPEVPALREAANRGVLAGLGPNESEEAYTQFLSGQLGKNIGQTPLLSAAIERAKADLALGGKLPQDVQNAVTRQALATSGAVSGNLGLGRDLTARDLGMTSLDLYNQRLKSATELGGMESEASLNNAAHMVNTVQLMRAINQDKFSRNMAAAQYGESIQRPVVGLDPGSVADIYAGNASNKSAALSNQANIYGAQANNYLQAGGNLAGMALMAYAGKKK